MHLVKYRKRYSVSDEPYLFFTRGLCPSQETQTKNITFKSFSARLLSFRSLVKISRDMGTDWIKIKMKILLTNLKGLIDPFRKQL